MKAYELLISTAKGAGSVGNSLAQAMTQQAQARTIFTNPTGKGIRGQDKFGSGSYGTRRDGGRRSHNGVDYISYAGQSIRAVIGGTITKIGYPYANDMTFRYVEISNSNYSVRHMYVLPASYIQKGSIVRSGDVIGSSQSLLLRYPGITDHVHIEIKYKGGYIDPTSVIP